MKHKAALMICIAIGGAAGAVLRYVLSGLAHKLIGIGFPWGTLAVNMIGCFSLGFFWNFIHAGLVPAHLNVLISVGLLGAFTTFSTFGLETVHLFYENKAALALGNIALSVIFGLLLVYLGILASRIIVQ